MAEQFVVKNGFISRERSTIYGDIFATNLPPTQSGAPATTYLGYLTASDEIVAVNDPRVTINNAGYGRIVQADGTGNTKNLYANSYNYFVSSSTPEVYQGAMGIRDNSLGGTLTLVNGTNNFSRFGIVSNNKYTINGLTHYAEVGSSIIYSWSDNFPSKKFATKIDYVYTNSARSKIQTGTIRATWQQGSIQTSDIAVTAIGFTKFFPFSFSYNSGNNTVNLVFTNGGTNTDTLYVTAKIIDFTVETA